MLKQSDRELHLGDRERASAMSRFTLFAIKLKSSRFSPEQIEDLLA